MSEFQEWAIVEIMGHRRLGGKVSEQEIAGGMMLRIDIPSSDPEKPAMTQFYGISSIYCLSPCTEEIARSFAIHNQPQPVQRWELPALVFEREGNRNFPRDVQNFDDDYPPEGHYGDDDD